MFTLINLSFMTNFYASSTQNKYLHNCSILLGLLKLFIDSKSSFLCLNKTVQLELKFIAILCYIQVW